MFTTLKKPTMGRNIIQTNLFPCSGCGEIFEVPPHTFNRDDILTKIHYEETLKCHKCQQKNQNHLNQQLKQITESFQSILMFCKNRGNGCTKELPSSDLHAHEISCDYRPVRCVWYLQCEQNEISFREYRKHLEKMHKPYIKKVHLNEEHDLVIKMLKDHDVVSVCTVVRDEKNNMYFTRKCSIDLQKDLFMVCVHYIGDKSLAKKLIYKVKIHQGMDHMNAFYEYSAYCDPFVEAPNSPNAHANCIVLHPKKMFLTDDYLTELKYSVAIKRVKDNVD